jgi:predicted Zn-dependent peptidase
MANLRELTAETVRQYHRDFYKPENLCLVVTGVVDTEELMAAIHKVRT